MNTEIVPRRGRGYQMLAAVLLATVGVFTFRSAHAEEIPQGATNSPVAISLHEGRDDLDAPFLRKLIHVRFERFPLIEAAAQLSEQVSVPVLVDQKAIKDAGMLINEPITFSTEQPGTRERVAELMAAKTPIEDWDANLVMRLDQVLDFILRQLDVTWFVEEGILHLTAQDHARMHHLIDRSYSLTPFRKQKIEDQSLRSALSREYWAAFGYGRGAELVTVGHILTLRESFQIQRRLKNLLQAIARPDDNQSGVYAEEEVACRQQLDRIVEADFLDTPLGQAIDILAYQSKGRIFLDEVVVEQSGGRIDQPITFSLEGESLHETLDIMLSDLKLVVTIKSGELFVTHPNVAREMRESRVHDLRAVATTKELRDSLVDAIMSLTSEQWENTDQGGELTMLENGVLIAMTNPAIHEEIAKLVDFYKQHLSIPNR